MPEKKETHNGSDWNCFKYVHAFLKNEGKKQKQKQIKNSKKIASNAIFLCQFFEKLNEMCESSMLEMS